MDRCPGKREREREEEKEGTRERRAGAEGKVKNAGTCWRTASLRGASTSSAPAPSMLLREAAAGNEVGARAGLLMGRQGRRGGRAGSRCGGDSSRAARAALSSAGRREGMRPLPWEVRRGRRRKRRARPGRVHDEIAA